MEILFTRGRSLFSKLITTATGESTSHVVVKYGNFIIHSNLKGVHVESYHTFIKNSTIVKALAEAPEGEASNRALKVMAALEKYENSWYDLGALFFIGFSLFLRNYLKIPMPKSNLWNASGMFICTEFVSMAVEGKTDSMVTPLGLFYKLEQEGWREVRLNELGQPIDL